MNADYIYLSEKLSLPIKQLLVSSPIAHAVYVVASREKLTPVQFLEKLALVFAEAHAELLAAELQRRLECTVHPLEMALELEVKPGKGKK